MRTQWVRRMKPRDIIAPLALSYAPYHNTMSPPRTLLLALVRVQNFKESLVSANVFRKAPLDRCHVVDGMIKLHRPVLRVAVLTRLQGQHRPIPVSYSLSSSRGIFCVGRPEASRSQIGKCAIKTTYTYHHPYQHMHANCHQAAPHGNNHVGKEETNS